MTRPGYRHCLEAGMTAVQTAAACGVNRSSVYQWARRNNVVFARSYANHGARLRKWHANPAHARAHAARVRRWHSDPKNNPLAALTPDERADYDRLKRAKYTRKEAFCAVGRGDLCAGVAR